ncbi:VCBS repeat-containing protein [Ruficoccus amylovorans]|uniref:VCBS repeat-containing protein n=1 Tax=Ruficoccus amylovorans TaxID=1804625 RepID=A0A842HHV8_9BACT|nr:FG-GAP-like repeat-containing protein [Ruficoccus amylovorans]MBC2595992.1 VCBS repeat-containing protein [Ruficoccus amylovorans]
MFITSRTLFLLIALSASMLATALRADDGNLLSGDGLAAPYGWRTEPGELWTVSGPGALEVNLEARLSGTSSNGAKRAMRTVRLPRERNGGLWRLSGWMRVEGGNHQRDAMLTIALQGGAGIRESVREFNPHSEWTYFEKRLRLPDGMAEVIVHINYGGRTGIGRVKELRLVPDELVPEDFSVEVAGEAVEPWRVEDRAYRLRGVIDTDEADAPVWADFDFQRLLLMAGCREPVDPSSVVVLAIDADGGQVACPVAFDQPIGTLADRYLRNGTLKWRSAPGAVVYEIYFNAAGPEGPRPLALERMLGVGELLTYNDEQVVPLWAGWPGVAIDPVDADGNGVQDLMVSSTDGGRFIARNIGTMTEPVFIPRMRELPTDDLPASGLMQQVSGDWDGSGNTSVLAVRKKPAGGYTDGVTATVDLRVPGKAVQTLSTPDGHPVVIDDATWTHLGLADFNGNGLPDLVVGSARDDLLILLNRSDLGAGVVEPFYVPFDIFMERPQGSGDMGLKPTVTDWNGDGRPDLLVTAWSGACWLFTNETGEGGVLRFSSPQVLTQKGGPLVAADSPVVWVTDFDGDGVADLLMGDVNGRLLFFRNTGTPEQPRWQAPVAVTTESGDPILLTARSVGAEHPVQGPAEWNWGYLSGAAWDLTGNGQADLIVNDSLGRLGWFENFGETGEPVFADELQAFTYQGQEVTTPWRNAPGVYDWTGDGYPELLVLNAEGNLVMLHLSKEKPGAVTRIEPMLDAGGKPVKINARTKPAGVSGRSNITVGDIDGDGKADILVGFSSYYEGGGAFLLGKNVGEANAPRFEVSPMRTGGGRMAEWTGSDGHDQWHNGGPCLVDWNGDGKPDLFHGVESGRVAYYANDYLNRRTFPIFTAEEFAARAEDGEAVALLNFGQLPAGELPVRVEDAKLPLQWLPVETLLQKGRKGPRYVRFTSPKPGEPVSGEVRIEVDAGTGGVATVKFYLNGEYLATESLPPYVAFGDDSTWDSRTVPDGLYELAAVATYIDGQTATAKVALEVSNGTPVKKSAGAGSLQP